MVIVCLALSYFHLIGGWLFENVETDGELEVQFYKLFVFSSCIAFIKSREIVEVGFKTSWKIRKWTKSRFVC
jgi:hypothetical protein